MNPFANKQFVFVHPENEKESGAGNIIQIAEPNMVAKISKYKEEDLFEMYKILHPISVQVEGYKILLVFGGNMNPEIDLDIATVKSVLSKMANYYFESRIKGKEYSFKQYKTNNNEQ